MVDSKKDIVLGRPMPYCAECLSTTPASPPEVDITNLPRRKSRQYECGNPLPPQVGPRVELRKNDDGTLDEFLIYVGDTCVYHLEQMNDDHWWMAAYLGDERVTVSLSARGKITATVEDRRTVCPVCVERLCGECRKGQT